MELELQYTELSCCEAGESVTLTQEEALEAAIPEYCPEVTRIVDAVGQLCLREYTSRQISGSVLVTVLYTSEESPGLRSLTLPVPFLTQADDKRLTGCDTVCMAGRLLLTEARAVTGRKLYLRVMPELTLTGYTCRRHRICTGVGEEPTLRLHRQEQSLTLLTSVTQRQSSVTQELQPQDWGEPPEELLAQRICPRITGSQPVGSRLLAKGEARICLLYRTQDGSLHTWEDTLPFSCLLDGLTVPEEAQVTVTGSCGTARLIRSDGAAAIGVELTLSLLVRTYETVTVAPVTDLYSTRWDTALQRQSLTLTETWPPETVQPEVHQELESRPFLYVTAADCGAVTTGPGGGSYHPPHPSAAAAAVSGRIRRTGHGGAHRRGRRPRAWGCDHRPCCLPVSQPAPLRHGTGADGPGGADGGAQPPMHMGRHYRRRADGAGAGTASLSGAVPAEERGEPVGAGQALPHG